MTLQFLIKNQNISRMDTTNIVSGIKNYLKAKFEFEGEDWEGVEKTAVFWSLSKGINLKVILDTDGFCEVPKELTSSVGDFYVSVFAGDLMTANYAVVNVFSSGLGEAWETPEEPTPDVYAQLLQNYHSLLTKFEVLLGGLEGQVLRKKSDGDLDFEWVTLPEPTPTPEPTPSTPSV